MWRTRMTRDQAEADRIEAELLSQVGQVSKWGRITDTLTGVERREIEVTGRPMYQVLPVVHNRDPLFDA